MSPGEAARRRGGRACPPERGGHPLRRATPSAELIERRSDGRRPTHRSRGAPPRASHPPRSVRALARRLRLRRVQAILLRRQPLRSEHVALGLRRDLRLPFPAPDAKVPVTVRPLRPADLPALFPDAPGALPAEELGDRRNRTVLATAGLGRGFVAVTADGRPCYVQWLLGPDDVERLRWHFSDIFPPLAPDEMLLEGAYTPQPHRGQGIMPHAMAIIAEQAAPLGARWVLTFATESNIPSLQGCRRAGFSPHTRRIDRWIALRRTLTFSPVPDR